MPTRRTFLIATTLGLGALAWRLHAETGKRTKRVGIVVWNRSTSDESHTPNEFVQELRERGWVEGQNIVFERRYFHGDRARLPGLMAELIALDVDVIFTQGAPATLAAQAATNRIPIVFSVGDAVGRGIVANLARPEGNATGVSGRYVEAMAKRVELLKQVSPGVSRVAAFMNTDIGYPPALFKERKPPGVEIFIVGLRGPDDLTPAMTAVARQRADAVVVGQVWAERPEFMIEIVEAVARQRLPAIFVSRAFVKMGGLLSYAEAEPDVSRQEAIYVDKILRGARPADLPVEQGAAFDLAINLKTAKALSITIPRELLVRADWIVE
jgi:putative tryptophan/tyrosine transport system substrate-binding protein